MEGAAAAAGGGEMLSPGEADWPPELRLPPPPPPSAASEGEPPPARAAVGMDDSQFLGSIIGLPAQPPQATAEALAVVGVKRRRGRPPKKRDGAAAATAVVPAARPARRREDEEEVVCFICFDGGNLVVCDRRGCPKVYHPACIKRDEAFFQSRSKWNCGWHICSSCEKAVHYMCYTCTYSLCKVCIKQGKFFSVRGTKGFCDTCYSTILLIESKDEGDTKIVVDFDDQNSWEYLFKLYWVETVTRDDGTLPNKVPTEEASLPVDTKWASPELLEFVGHMRDGDQSFISQFDVQALLLDYIKQNNLRDPQRKSQIICDSRLHRLFRKTRVAHFEMLKLLEMHFIVSEPSAVNDGSQGIINPDSAQIDHASGYNDMAAKFSPDRRRRMHRKMEREPQANPEDYAAIDMHNINLIYLRRSLMEDLIDDPTLSDKISGAFVRIRISGLGQKQDMYRLVKVVGTHKVSEKYSIGKKMTNFALEIMNLNKKEIITMDTVSNQDFTEEECKRLRQSMKYDLISRLKVGDIQEKAKIFQFVRVNDWFENEKQKLCHLRDRASETGQCVEKLQLLNTPEERARRINEVLDVHVDSHMDPDYESDDEFGNKKAVERSVNWARSDPFVSPVKVKYSNSSQKNGDATRHLKNLSKQNTERKSGAARNFENSHSPVGMDIPKSGTNVKSTRCETTSPSSHGVVSSDMEPEKVWHYKDPSGNVQGPFTLVQLSKWTSYFPRDMRVWLTFESEERSLLLTEVLSKQPKDFGQPASVTTSSKSTVADTGQNRNTEIVDLNKAPSPVGYSMLNSFETTVQSTKHSAPERESVNSLDDRLSHSTDSVPPKDANASNSQAMCQIKHSGSLPSPGSPHQRSDLHHDEVQGGRSGEWNNQHNSELWSPSMPQTSSSAHSNVESHHDHYPSWSQVQHDPKNSLQAGSGKDLNSRYDIAQKLPSQRITRDVPSPVFAWSPSESRTASSQHEGSCLSSTTNLCTHDELHSSIASAKAKSFAPATPVEDRGSSSPSGMLSLSERAPICSPQSAPSASASDTCKMEENMNQQKTLEADISNTSSKILPESSSDNQDIKCEDPSPTPISKSKEVSPQSKILSESYLDNQDVERECPSSILITESKELAVDLPGSISLAPEKTASTDVGENSSLAFIFPKSTLAGDDALKSVFDMAKAHLECEDSKVKEELYVESTVVIRDDMVVNPASGVESIDMSENLLESLMEQSCGTFYMDGTTALEGFLSGSTKEEPQCSSPIALSTCSSPIALSPWGEHGYYQGDSVGSSLWGVQDDDPIGNIWPLSSQAPALQYSSGSTAHFIDEATVTHGNNGVVLSSTPGEEVGLPNSGVCTDWGLVEQVNPETNDASVSMIDKNSGLVDSQPSANDGSDVGTARNTNHNTNLSLNHETAVPLSRSSGEASRKHGFITDLNVATSEEALGNTKNWNPYAGNANRGSQRNHHRDRYSQISESWLLSSNYSRSRSDGFGTGGSSRSTPRGQTQRGICKFLENGYCRKGASCNYLHP
uniref:Zinc finger CCCH domain-containing protein 44 n=1 Tax=Oryza rufipogon TaxID=4529 RepID=A0A0E0NNP1_ORYRU